MPSMPLAKISQALLELKLRTTPEILQLEETTALRRGQPQRTRAKQSNYPCVAEPSVPESSPSRVTRIGSSDVDAIAGGGERRRGGEVRCVV